MKMVNLHSDRMQFARVRCGLRLLGALLLSGVLGLPVPAAAAADTRPNIVFVLVDDLGWGDVGYHGAEIRTPTLDALARRGVELNRYYSYAVCSPTRAALMSGRSSLETGIDAPISLTKSLDLNARLLPQYLKQQGYQTAMVGKWHLGQARSEFLPHNRGFDYFYGFLGGFIDHFTHISYQGGLDWQRNGKSVREAGYSTDLFTDDAIRQIRGRDKSRPLFLYLAYDAPHTPLQAPEADLRSYDTIKDPRRRAYAAMVQHFDSQFARVLAAIEAEGMSKDTLIVWASDNGPQPGGGSTSGGLRGTKGTSFEGGQRVPAIAFWAGRIEGGRKLETPMTVLDWFPTLLNLAGVQRPSDRRIVGNDVMPNLIGAKATTADSFVLGNHVQGNGYYESAYQWPWKMVRAPAGSIGPNPLPAGVDPASRQSLLFNVVADPVEAVNMADRNQDMLTRLTRQLDAAPRAAASLTEWADNQAAGGARAGGDGHGGGGQGALPGGGNDPSAGYKEEKQEPFAEAAVKASTGKP